MMLEDLLGELGDDRLEVETIHSDNPEAAGRYLLVSGLRYPEPEAWAQGDGTPDQLRAFVQFALEDAGRTFTAALTGTTPSPPRPGALPLSG